MQTENNPLKKELNFIKKLFEGNIPLWKAYWLLGVFGILMFEVLFFVLTFTFHQEHRVASFIIGAALLLEIFYFVVVIIVIWKSAGKKHRGGSRFWANLARATLIIAILFIIIQNVNFITR